MKRPTSTPSARIGIAALALFAVPALATWSPSAAATAVPLVQDHDEEHEEHGEEEVLHEAMEHMKASVRRMGKLLQGGRTADCLPLLADFQAHAVAAKGELPELAEGLEGAERERFVTGFRMEMVKLVRTSCDLELALLAGKTEEAQRIFQSELRPLEKSGHAEYRDKE